jgi:hypothetical protein
MQMPVLKVKNNEKWECVGGTSTHQHNKSDIVDLQTSLSQFTNDAGFVTSEYVSEQIELNKVVVDDTLTVSGQAADAAAVGEALDLKANKADIPTTIPNPYALTINGKSYDGSEVVTVDVADGKDGYTPIRGTDYWTEEDKQEIKTYVDEVIAGIEEALAEI